MNRDIQAKATSLENLHKMASDMIALSNSFCKKHPEFDATLSISHSDLIVNLCLKRAEDE